MHRTRCAFTAVCTLVAGRVSLASPTSAEPDLRSRLDRAIADKAADMDVPGVIVDVSVPASKNDYRTAVGVADTATGRPTTPADRTRIGSVTKTFTGTAVLQLVDQGRIRLGDPISQYIGGVPAGERITLDMLGRMRSEFYDYSEDEAWVDKLFAESPDGLDAFAQTPQPLLDAAFSHPPTFAPDTDYQHSNTNTVLLALVVEKVSGLPFGEYLRRNIFAPTGLIRTSYPGNGALLNPQTQAQQLANPSAAAPGAGYSFAIFDTHGLIGRNRDIPGYTTVLVYLPERDATLSVSVKSGVPSDHAAGQIAKAVTAIVTPHQPYDLANA